MTYRILFPPDLLLDKLIERCNAPSYVYGFAAIAVMDRVVTVLVHWLKSNFTGKHRCSCFLLFHILLVFLLRFVICLSLSCKVVAYASLPFLCFALWNAELIVRL